MYGFFDGNMSFLIYWFIVGCIDLLSGSSYLFTTYVASWLATVLLE